MTPLKQAVKDLKAAGYFLKRSSGGHDIYYNPKLNTTIPLKRHAFNETHLRYIRKEIEQCSKRGNPT